MLSIRGPRWAAASSKGAAALFLTCVTACLTCSLARAQDRIPATEATALDEHTVVLPRDLPGRATVLILACTQLSGTSSGDRFL